jgi:GNAT superfamily N-acetyltransferase
MPDMLVRLYALPDLGPALDEARDRGVVVRRALAPEKRTVIDWVATHFPTSASEADIAFARTPVACFIALRDTRIVGFACHDATCRGFFGPEGVLEAERGRGVGRALLLAALHAQREQGYAYSIIGGVGPAAFYARTVGAIPIPDSSPGIYASMLPLAPRSS